MMIVDVATATAGSKSGFSGVMQAKTLEEIFDEIKKL
jgi:hypothetical protein